MFYFYFYQAFFIPCENSDTICVITFEALVAWSHSRFGFGVIVAYPCFFAYFRQYLCL
jgi:hypothetical protein